MRETACWSWQPVAPSGWASAQLLEVGIVAVPDAGIVQNCFEVAVCSSSGQLGDNHCPLFIHRPTIPCLPLPKFDDFQQANQQGLGDSIQASLAPLPAIPAAVEDRCNSWARGCPAANTSRLH